MDRCTTRRKWLLAPTLALLLAGCGGDDKSSSPAADAPVPSAQLVKRCSLEVAKGDGGFPAGLLPPGSAVTADGTAVADGKLAEVFAQLQKRDGYTVRDSELETLDAELELEGPGGEASLQLELAPGCPRATRIKLS